MSHTVELIAVGTELLLGNIANTDAQMLSRELSSLGLNVLYHSVVGDNPGRLEQAIVIAKGRADIIITTGGLGPTCDDLTKQTLAKAFGKKLVFHEDIAEGIRSYFDKLGREMTENNLQQAELPEDCTIFHNDWGTAPGCAFEAEGIHVLMLPGPPYECENMFRHCAADYLKGLSEGVIVSRTLRIFGMGESAVEHQLRQRMNELVNPSLAPYAKEGEVELRITAKADTKEQAKELLSPVEEEVRVCLGDYIYGADVTSLEEVVQDQLKEKGLTFGTAESCTGGLIAKRMTDLPGAASIFRGGIVSYTNEVKKAALGVPSDMLEQFSAVSRPVAEAMAQGARELLGCDIAVSVTGVAGPDPDDRGNPVGLVFVALCTEDGCTVKELNLGSGRGRIRTMAANYALDLARRYLMGK
jgi:nicotinamide-nucleotide amidase